jgi:hypothetical protein
VVVVMVMVMVLVEMMMVMNDGDGDDNDDDRIVDNERVAYLTSKSFSRPTRVAASGRIPTTASSTKRECVGSGIS